MALSENDTLAATRSRLAEIEQELAQLNEQRDQLYSKQNGLRKI